MTARCWQGLVSTMFLLMGTLFASPLFLGDARAQNPNLLTNPGFESGTDGWAVSDSSVLTFSTTTLLSHGGSRSAMLISSGSTVNKGIYQNVTGIVGGNQYKLTGYGYIPPETNVLELFLRIHWYSSSDCSGAELPGMVESATMTTVGIFQLLQTLPSTAPPTAHCARIRAVLMPTSSGSATAYFDDLALTLHNAVSTDTPTSTAVPCPKLLIVQVLADGVQTGEGDEFVALYNPNASAVSLTGYKIGDEETHGDGEGMYRLPEGVAMPAYSELVIARNATQFQSRFGLYPDYELVTSDTLTDAPSVPNLAKYSAWGSGTFALSNSGDEILLLGPSDQTVDAVAWGTGDFAHAGLSGDASAPTGISLQRYGTYDSDNMIMDFLRAAPDPYARVVPPTFPTPPAPASMPNGLSAYWGDLHAHSTVSDGSGPPRQAFDYARAAGLHFFALTDHDGHLTPGEWNAIGSTADVSTVDGTFVGLRGFEYTSNAGHLTVLNTDMWVSRADSAFDTLAEIYAWLGVQTGALAEFNHPDPRYGADFDNLRYDTLASQQIFSIEIGNNGHDSYKRYLDQYPASLHKRWRVAPAINSDHHGLVWGTDSPHRVGLLAPALTRDNVLQALRSRRVFATEDNNLALALQANDGFMGSTVQAGPELLFTITARDPEPEPVQISLYDARSRLWSQSFESSNVSQTVTLAPGSSYYYAVAAQADGDIAYTAPIWLNYGTYMPSIAR